jgi:AcrR family transcriptional regulator
MDSKVTGHELGRRRRTAQILDSARDLLRAGEDLTVERIAHGAGVSPATVFNLVGPRERIWSALIEAVLQDVDDSLGPMTGEAPRIRAVRTVTALAAFFAADPAVYRHVATQFGHLAKQLGRGPLARVYAALTAAVADGDLRPGVDVKRLAAAIQTTCVGALHQWGAGLIDDAEFQQRCAFGVDLAFAAGGTDDARRAVVAELDLSDAHTAQPPGLAGPDDGFAALAERRDER